jgi:alkylation response protein AidB-like acyl-CoA dehydrogenase
MNFDLTEEQRLLQEMAREFAQKDILPVIKTYEASHTFPGEIIRKLASLGILGMTVPPEYGGTKTDSLSVALVIEELSKASPTVGIVVSVHCSLFCYALCAYGTEAQRKKYLPRAAAGEILGAFSITEPGAGSDATAIKTRAAKSGDHFLLNGRKAWVTTGSEAEALILVAATEGQEEGKKLSAFIVEKSFPGFKVAKIEEKLGLQSSVTAELLLEDCAVPVENLLGEEGRGASLALRCLDYSRIGVAAQSVGVCSQALEEAVKYAKQREAFGRKIAEFQALQFMIADMATLTEAARLLTYRAAELHQKGHAFARQAAMAKLFASEAANKAAYHALQIHGGYGYSQEFPVERIYRDARVLTLYEGTSEIQRLVIARSLLKEFD